MTPLPSADLLDADRPLASSQRSLRELTRSLILKVLGGIGVIVLLGLIASQVNLKRDFSRLDLQVLSGVPEGNYHGMIDQLGNLAREQGGILGNVSSQGSLDNARRLEASARSCEVQFGLVQDGVEWPKKTRLELIGRLRKAESLFLLGKKADELRRFSDLTGLRIGVGPRGSGTARIVAQIFALKELAGLKVKLEHHETGEQLDLAVKGELDLAAFVIDEDASLVVKAVRDLGLQIAGFPHFDVVARRIPYLRHGRIGAGQYDAVRMLPATDKRVLRVSTLLVGNRCRRRSQTVALMTVVQKQQPDFIRHNRESPNTSGLPLSATAKSFFDNQGAELADEYIPWLVDIMPPPNWVYIAMTISLLFNAMTFGHRFRLWRIDAGRVSLESDLVKVFGPATTVGDIKRIVPRGELLSSDVQRTVSAVIAELQKLSGKAREQSLSVLVPMGQEMAYRYQEELMHQMLAVLRAFQQKSAEENGAAPPRS